MCYNVENAKILLQLTALAQKTREYLAALTLANEMIDTVDGNLILDNDLHSKKSYSFTSL